VERRKRIAAKAEQAAYERPDRRQLGDISL